MSSDHETHFSYRPDEATDLPSTRPWWLLPAVGLGIVLTLATAALIVNNNSNPPEDGPVSVVTGPPPSDLAPITAPGPTPTTELPGQPDFDAQALVAAPTGVNIVNDKGVVSELVPTEGVTLAVDDGIGGVVLGRPERLTWLQTGAGEASGLTVAANGKTLTLEDAIPRDDGRAMVVYTEHGTDAGGAASARILELDLAQPAQPKVLIERGEAGDARIVAIPDVTMTETHLAFVQRSASGDVSIVVRDQNGESVNLAALAALELVEPVGVALDRTSLAILTDGQVHLINLRRDAVDNVIDTPDGTTAIDLDQRGIVLSGTTVGFIDRKDAKLYTTALAGNASGLRVRPTPFANDPP